MTWILIDFSWVGVEGGREDPSGDSREGSCHLPLPHVAIVEWGNVVQRKERDSESQNMPDSAAPLCTSAGVCFHFLWNKTLDHMFSLLIDSWVEKGQECGLFARWSLGCWHLVEGRGHYFSVPLARFISCSKKCTTLVATDSCINHPIRAVQRASQATWELKGNSIFIVFFFFLWFWSRSNNVNLTRLIINIWGHGDNTKNKLE